MTVQRRFVRWQVDKPAQIKLEGAQVFCHCRIKDVSLKGLQISLGMKLPKDRFFKLILVLSVECILDLEAWIAWQRSINGVNTYGLYFTQIKEPDKEKIYQFIRRHFPAQMNKKWWEGFDEERGGEEMEDRRIFERFAVELPVNFLDLRQNREGQATTCNISAKGIGLVAQEELKPHTPLEIWLKVPDEGEPFYTRGEVVWSKMIGPAEYRVGVNLEKADLVGVARLLRARNGMAQKTLTAL